MHKYNRLIYLNYRPEFNLKVLKETLERLDYKAGDPEVVYTELHLRDNPPKKLIVAAETR